MSTTTHSRRRPERRVWQLATVMAAAAAAVAVPGFLADPRAAAPSLAWVVLLPLFAVAEVLVIHLPAERSSHSHVLREIPAVAGLAFLAPQQYVTAYVCGAGLSLLLWTRLRGVKLGFNLAMFSVEAVLGSATFHVLLQGGEPVGVRAWFSAVAAVLATDLFSAGAVTAAISLTESRYDPEVLRQAISTGVPAALVNTCVALLVVTLVVDRPLALPLLAVLVAILVAGYRVHVRMVRGYTRMQLLYDFVGSTGHVAGFEETIEHVLSQAVRLLRATTAEVVTVRDGRLWRRFTWRDGELSVDAATDGPAATWWSPALAGESVLLRHETSARARHGAGDRPRDGMAAPIRPAETVEAVLLVADRTFEGETFGHEDLRVFETLAAHAAVALDKSRMLDRLRQVADERAHEALHDQLTGLPNRRAFDEAVEETMQRGGTSAVLLLDLDDFKDVNVTLGHGAGDRLLSVTGQRLVEATTGTAGAVVARHGGDEFAVLVPGLDAREALDLAEQLRELLSEPVPLAGVQLATSASIGVTEIRGGDRDRDQVLAQADVAMHAAKATRAGVQAYRPEDSHATARRMALAADLKVALREGELELWYQPQAHAGSGRVTGFEALLRWDHPTFGFVPPPEIVAVAHRTGLTRALTDSLLGQALVARAAWARAGHDLDVSVNLTTADVGDMRLVDRVDEELRRTCTPPGALVLEITESDAMRDLETAVQVMSALAARGVRLSVDDFGTGHSSLAYLDRLPVHEVKIDQSFVFRLERNAADSTIMRATVSLAHDLGLRVVAEGVENDLAKALTADLGCDLHQGYGLARPMPAGDVLGWLARHEAHARVRVQHG